MEIYIFWASCWVVYFVAGFWRTIRNGNYEGVVHCVSVAWVASMTGLLTSMLIFGNVTQEKQIYAFATGGVITMAGREVTDGIILKLLKLLGVCTDDGKSKKPRK